MSRSRRTALSAFFVLIIAALLAACAGQVTSPEPAVVEVTRVVEATRVVEVTPEPLTRLVVVVGQAAPIAGQDGATFAVAKQLGFFKEEGLEPVWEFCGGSVAAVQLLLAGNAGIAQADAEPVFKANMEGINLKQWYTIKGRSGYFIAVLPDSPIEKLEDLKGKIVGAPSLGSGAIPTLKGQLAQFGIRAEDFTFVAAGTGAPAAQAITAGQVDALVLWDSMYAQLENAGVELRYIDLPLLDKMTGMGYVSQADWLEENPQIAEGFCRAITKAFYWSHANPDAAMRIAYRVFPSLQPYGVPVEDAVANDRNVMEWWFKNVDRDQFTEHGWGYEWPEKWAFTEQWYFDMGTGVVTTLGDETNYYTNEFVAACNDFDKEALKAAAEAFVVPADW